MTDMRATTAGLPPAPFQTKIDPVEVVRTSWRIFRAQPWRYVWLLFIPALVSLPFSLLQALIGKGRDVAIVVGLLAIVSALIQYGVSFTCWLAAVYGVHRNMEGSFFTTGEALRVGFSRLLPYLGFIVLAAIMLVVGFVFFIIPMIALGVFLAPAGAACLIERRGPIGSIQRSFELVWGNWWRSFFALLLAILIPTLAVLAIGLLFYLVFEAMNVLWLMLILIVPAIPAFIVISTVSTIIPAVLFLELRTAKEGRRGDGLASVFE